MFTSWRRTWIACGAPTSSGILVFTFLFLSSFSRFPAAAEEAGDARAAALDRLEAQIRYANSEQRKYAIGRVSALPEPERPRFVALVRETASGDLDPGVRQKCLMVLSELEDAESLPVFLSALTDTNRDVVRAGLTGLSVLKKVETGGAVADFVRAEDFTENNQVLIQAIRLLMDLKYTEISDFLDERMDDERTHPELQLSILLYYGGAGISGARERLRAVLGDEEAGVQSRAYAVNSLGKLGNTEDVAALQEELGHIRDIPDANERARLSPLKLQLITALVRLGDETVADEILAAARDDSAMVRLRAVQQIVDARLTRARPMLEYMSEHDPSRSVKAAAARALEELDGG
ncbi:MAG: hypothetical protein H7A21_19415 [Spirochaetales bacterium]|nr:hypothetical protein [Candidatus Dadabacteria bacterium]MCB1327827.1 hypothetical protein [Leptospiraceae bacterium]MCP5483615.1 hypothetical protein [Spirochaetales bacterium]MCP5484520.1 hypothetical protein [Spirochaetales bacterium]